MIKFPPRNGKVAFITGISGQDGSYLAELLLGKGYEVWGMIRRSSSAKIYRLEHIYQDPHEKDMRLQLCHGDLCDTSSINHLLRTVQPDEVYNLGSQSDVMVSFEVPEYTGEVTALGTIRLLEAMREEKIEARFYQASSSEMFGKAVETPQNESTPFHPRSPYAVSKVFAHYATQNYRESYGMYAVNGILFNHESPKRGESFVTRKISLAAARIAEGLQDCLYLGNLNAERDWGFAGDYVEAMWLMLQQDEPNDYVICTGETHSVREFCELCFAEVDLSLKWEGTGNQEIGVDEKGRKLVEVDPRYFRPAEVDALRGDYSKAKRELGWQPTVGFVKLAKMMVNADLEEIRRQKRFDDIAVKT